MFEQIAEKIKGNGFRLVFTEGFDPRILEAASRLKKENLLVPILLGNPELILEKANEIKCDIEGIEIINPLNYDKIQEMANKLFELRKGKMDEATALKTCKQGNYFGTMLVKMGYADGLLGGATYSTADTVRPALQIIKTSPNSRIVSSCFILVKGDEKYAMGDCAINIKPTSDELVDIAIQTANTAKVFGIEPKVAMLSYSTLGSGSGEDVDKVRTAATKLKIMNIDFDVEGELQFDAAISETVANIKAKNSKVAGKCNTFIFPDINAGNIGYKIGQRLGGYEAIGPILQGLAAPINDLSRGCTAEEVYKMAILTAALK
ncbi:MAG: phosphate acetyltransferase [Erysipelotrichaceae bacterium]|nr:phosphate acetyltransferase [Erysipelotrichaceae bacterium]